MLDAATMPLFFASYASFADVSARAALRYAAYYAIEMPLQVACYLLPAYWLRVVFAMLTLMPMPLLDCFHVA